MNNAESRTRETSEPEAAPSPPEVTGAHVVAILVVVGGLLGSLWLVLRIFNTATDAATVLGIVIPAFATIGAAVFGVTVAYQAGSAKGQSKGKDEGQQQGKEKMASQLRPIAARLQRSVAIDLLSPVRTALESPSGTDEYRLAQPSQTPPRLHLSGSTLSRVEADVQTLVTLLGVHQQEDDAGVE